jgi:hypothetical protein
MKQIGTNDTADSSITSTTPADSLMKELLLKMTRPATHENGILMAEAFFL